jgi:leader peptidase (prepilin peptidase)/N-methyltransferase
MNDLLLDDAGRIFMVACLAVLGAVLGSFMNVVVYRLPRRMSLSRPGSHCPACQHPIRWHDNVPVVGWLALGGRCRDCGASISARYPLVEALVACVAGFLAVQAMTPLLVDPNGMEATLYELDLPEFAFRLLLLCTLICAALIEADALLPPRRLLVVPLVAGAIMLIVWPDLLPHSELAARDGLAAALAAMLVALVLSAAAWPAWAKVGSGRGYEFGAIAAGELVLVAMFLGERAVSAIGPASLAVYVVTQLTARTWPPVARFGWGAALVLTTLAWLLLADRIDLPEWAGWESPGRATLLAGSIMFFLANCLRLAGGARLSPGN